jgi:adenine deaminase
VAKNGKMLINLREGEFDSSSRDTVKLKRLEIQDFEVQPPVIDGTVEVNTIDFSNSGRRGDEGEAFAKLIITKLGRAKLNVRNGSPSLGKVALVFVFERHGKNGGRGFGFVRNLIRRGAVASTVAHDSHNLLVVGTDIRDMQAAANLVIQSSGGISAVSGLETLAWVKLPIAGLISDRTLQHVAQEVEQLRRAFKKMGVLDHPYMPLSNLLALSVIPHARITDRGLFDVDNQRFVAPFVS